MPEGLQLSKHTLADACSAQQPWKAGQSFWRRLLDVANSLAKKARNGERGLWGPTAVAGGDAIHPSQDAKVPVSRKPFHFFFKR